MRRSMFLALCIGALLQCVPFAIAGRTHARIPPQIQGTTPIYGEGKFVREENSFFPNWVCHHGSVSTLRAECVDLGYHETEGRKGTLEIEFTREGERHFFILRHAIYWKECAEYGRQIRKLLRHPTPFCVRALGGILKQNDLKPERIWNFAEFWSPEGHVVEFEFPEYSFY
jgi:hypothetical protein